jgi:CheY-like chemotaxis protein
MIFKDEGAEVIEVPDANQAMRALKAGKPDLMTLDLIMPHKTGEHLYWELRKDPNFADLPIVIITGYARVETPAINFHKFIAEKNLPEPEGFLEKPIQPEAVLDTAIKILEKKTGIQN